LADVEELDGIVDGAATKYGNWHGSSAADDSDYFDSLYELLPVDSDTHWIVALKLTVNEGLHVVRAFTVPRSFGYDSLAEKIKAGESIEVTMFEVVEHDDEGYAHVGALERLSPFDVLHQAFKRWEIYLEAEVLADHPDHQLRVTERTRLAEPE
jgi:hypothetical protein